MKAKDLKQQKFSMYNNFWEVNNIVVTFNQYIKLSQCDYIKNLINYIRDIKDDARQKEEKSTKVPAATMHCVMGKSRSKNDIIEQNNLFVLDIDGQDNPVLLNKEGRDNIKNLLIKEQYVLMVAESCRGKGLYVVIGIEDKEKVRQYFKKLEKIYKEKYNLVVDKSCKDENRFRLISWDADARIKDGEDDIILFNEYEEETDIRAVYSPNNNLYKHDIFNNNECVYMLIKMIFDNGYRTNEYYDWLICGFNLKFLGYDAGFKIFNYISSISDGYNERKVKEKWDEVFRTGKNTEEQMISFWGAKAKKYIGENWKEKVKFSYIKNKYKN